MTRRRRQSRAGFTLIEMMVAVLAGSIAIASIYYMSAASARHFHEQQRVAQTQQALRMAMDQIRRDVERAGYLGTPASDREQRCVNSAQPIQAVALVNAVAADTAALTNAVTNGVHADRLRLTANYTTGDAYLIQSMNAGGTEIYLQKTWQGFRRSFGVDGGYDPASFDQTFAVGRWLHITTQDGNHLFLEITGADGAADPPSVEFTPSIASASCATSILGSTVAPLSRIEYVVRDVATAAELTALRSASATPLPGVNGPALVRREIDFAAVPTAVAQSERIVAEYVANFDVDVVVDTAVALPPILQAQDDAIAVATLGADPERVRSAIVRLSVRTAAEDPRFAFTLPITTPATRYELDPAVEGAARVRTATAEILIPNVAYRGLR